MGTKKQAQMLSLIPTTSTPMQKVSTVSVTLSTNCILDCSHCKQTSDSLH